MGNNINISDEDILLFYHPYFFLAELGCKELIDGKHGRDKSIGFPIPYTVDNLIFPIIYSVKHGTEIFYKSIVFAKDKEYLLNPNPKIKINNTHDILFLYSWFEKIIITKIKNKLINYSKSSCDIKNMDEDDVNNDLSKIKELTSYFYNNNWLSKNSRCADKLNDICRYAKSKITKKIDYESEIENIEIVNIKIIYDKIKSLHDISSAWGYTCETV